MMTDRTSNDPRHTLATVLLTLLPATLFLADRALDGSAQTIARVVLVAAVLAATAWTGAVLRGAERASDDGRGAADAAQ